MGWNPCQQLLVMIFIKCTHPRMGWNLCHKLIDSSIQKFATFSPIFAVFFLDMSLSVWQDERGEALDPARGEESWAVAVVVWWRHFLSVRTNEGKPWILPVVKKAEQACYRCLMTSLPVWQDERGEPLDPARGEEGWAGLLSLFNDVTSCLAGRTRESPGSCPW